MQYGGSSTLLSQIKVGDTGDLYLAGDDGYTELAHEKGLVEERIPVAAMRPVLAVQMGNPKHIRRIEDLLRSDVRVALGNPDQAAIGQKTRQSLVDSGHWAAVERRVTDGGVFKPTVPEVANDVKLGSVDVGIIWDATVGQYPELEAIRVPELDRGEVHVTLGVMSRSKDPAAALHFARYLAARDRGLEVFRTMGYKPVDGDVWAEVPEVTFFAGSVNRRALAPIIKEFEAREGVVVNTIYNGCGILTAQMRTLNKNQDSGFPDVYMACDVYYLDTVRDQLGFALAIRRIDRRTIDRRVAELAELLEIGPLLGRGIAGLSGGEKQRVALGRALAFWPATLCLDEPLGALDDDTHDQTVELLKRVQKETGVTALHITHNRHEATVLADLLLELADGKVRPVASPCGQLVQPKHNSFPLHGL